MKKQFVLNHRTFADLSKNDEITENGIYTYLCLKPLVNNYYTYLHITVTELNSVLSDADIIKRPKQQDIIKQGLKELEAAEYIKIITTKKNDFDYELDVEGMVEEYSKDNPFTIYEVDAFKQALKDNNGYKTIFKYLSNYFYKITHNEMSADDSELYYFNADRESLAKDCELSVRSIDKYNDILVNNEIIYIHKHDYKYTDSNKQVPNAYGLYKNKDKIDEKCNEYISGLKDGVYQSSIPRGKGSKKLMEEAKKAQFTPVEEAIAIATDEELKEHDNRHKELYAKRMAKKMEKEKTVVAESVPMQEVEEVVQADSKEETDNKVIDFEAIIAERKAETNTVLSDNNKKETIQADRKHKITIEEFERKWYNKPIQKVEKKKIEKVVEPVETHRVDRDEEYNVLISELNLNSDTTFDKASKMFNNLLLEKFGFVNEDADDKALKERFKNEWETSITVQKVEPIIEEEENPFA